MRTEAAMNDLTLEELDRDGAFREAFDRVHRQSRAEFLGKAVVGGGALMAAVAVAPPPARAKKDDTEILNFDLAFEYMQAGFYTEAERVGTVDRLPANQARAARVFGTHERAHVEILKQVLGAAAIKKPFFNYRGVTEDPDDFIRTVVALEDLTTALLAGQSARLRSRQLIAAVFSLLTVEARHAAWVRHVAGTLPVGPAFDEPKTLAEVDEVIESTNFRARRPTTKGAGAPRFTG
jgi:hypothetical protein